MHQTAGDRTESNRPIATRAEDTMTIGLVHGVMLSAILWAALGWAWLLLR